MGDEPLLILVLLNFSVQTRPPPFSASYLCSAQLEGQILQRSVSLSTHSFWGRMVHLQKVFLMPWSTSSVLEAGSLLRHHF